MVACERQSFTVSGHLDDCSSNFLIIDEIQPDGITVLDTILLIDGDFRYPIKNREESIYRLRLNDTTFISFMGKKGDKLQISGNAKDLLHTYQICGNKASKILWEVNQRVDAMYRLTDSLSQLFKTAQIEGKTDSIIPLLDSCYYTHFQSCKSYLQNIIENNPDQLVVLPVFYQKVGVRSFFSETNDRALWEEMLTHLQKHYPDNAHVKALQERHSTKP